MNTLRWYTMDLRAPIQAAAISTLTPDNFDGTESVFRYRLPDSIKGNIEVQADYFPGTLEFAGTANDVDETIAIPTGRYFFSQDRISQPPMIMQTMTHLLAETHKEAVWRRLEASNTAYIRILQEGDSIVVQVFFQLIKNGL